MAIIPVLLASCEKRLPTAADPGSPRSGTVMLAKKGGGGGGSGSANTFSGDATALRAAVLGTTTELSKAGPLPPQGGADEASLLTANVPGVLTANVLHATTVAMGERSRSEASVADLNLTVGGHAITASFLIARAEARCAKNAPSTNGSAGVVNLVVDGTPIVVTGSPNQTVELPLGAGRVVINEQSSSTGDITVRALHVVVTGVADVVVSEAHADIQCRGRGECPQDRDFVTGGGWITGTPSGAKGTFGVGGGIKNGAFWGHLTYIDHGSGGPKVKGTGVTAYVVLSSTARRIDGNCEIDGRGGFTYRVEVSDNGEPGRNDTFSLRLSNGYSAAGSLGGGNIQLHTCP